MGTRDKSQSEKAASPVMVFELYFRGSVAVMWLITKRKGILGSKNIICKDVMIGESRE